MGKRDTISYGNEQEEREEYGGREWKRVEERERAWSIEKLTQSIDYTITMCHPVKS